MEKMEKINTTDNQVHVCVHPCIHLNNGGNTEVNMGGLGRAGEPSHVCPERFYPQTTRILNEHLKILVLLTHFIVILGVTY